MFRARTSTIAVLVVFAAASASTQEARRESYTMELALVHSAPNRPDEVQSQTLKMGAGGASFRFRPVTLVVEGGSLGVAYFASLQFTAPFQVTRGFQIFAEPQLVFTATGAAAPEPMVRGERFYAAGPMPGSDEILKFDLPPIQFPKGSVLPDRFSLRMQIRTVQ